MSALPSAHVPNTTSASILQELKPVNRTLHVVKNIQVIMNGLIIVEVKLLNYNIKAALQLDL